MMRTLLLAFLIQPFLVYSQTPDDLSGNIPRWYLSVQYLGITYHPDGGTTPEVYPLKLDDKAFVVLNVGFTGNIDFILNKTFFLRFTTSLYKDCAFVTADCVHAGPRVQYSWKRNCVNLGIGPIFSFREDWHQFKEYITDDFYGDRVSGKWQYRFFPNSIEFEYLRRINDHLEFQYSLIPGAPLVFTSMLGVRFRL